jgi:hypothetical protein
MGKKPALHEIWRAVFTGLAREALTDPELIVLTVGSVAATSRSRTAKGLGIAMVGWYATRKADTYMMVFDSKMGLLAQVISAGESKEIYGD